MTTSVLKLHTALVDTTARLRADGDADLCEPREVEAVEHVGHFDLERHTRKRCRCHQARLILQLGLDRMRVLGTRSRGELSAWARAHGRGIERRNGARTL